MSLKEFSTQALNTALEIANRFQAKDVQANEHMRDIIDMYADFADYEFDTAFRVLKAVDKYYSDGARSAIRNEISRREKAATKLDKMAEAYWVARHGPMETNWANLNQTPKNDIRNAMKAALEAGGYEL